MRSPHRDIPVLGHTVHWCACANPVHRVLCWAWRNGEMLSYSSGEYISLAGTNIYSQTKRNGEEKLRTPAASSSYWSHTVTECLSFSVQVAKKTSTSLRHEDSHFCWLGRAATRAIWISWENVQLAIGAARKRDGKTSNQCKNSVCIKTM